MNITFQLFSDMYSTGVRYLNTMYCVHMASTANSLTKKNSTMSQLFAQLANSNSELASLLTIEV